MDIYGGDGVFTPPVQQPLPGFHSFGPPITGPIPLPGGGVGGFHHGPLSMAVAARHLVAAHAHRQAAARAALAATSPRPF